MKLFTACLSTETNTFSPIPTGLKSFAVTRHGDYSTYPPFADSGVAFWRKMATERGWDTFESLIAAAEPAGKTLRYVYEKYRDEIVDDLKQAMPVDVVLLDLHGAMVAEGYDDCEGDLIESIRKVVGPSVPIGVELDLHCHITPLMMEQATVIITYKEYPHTDTFDRAVELFNIIADTAAGKVKPTMALYDTGMIGLYYPTQEPMKSYVDGMKELEKEPGVLSISLGHGFPWGDVPGLGTKTLVVTDNNAGRASELAEQLGRELYAMRSRAFPIFHTIDSGLDAALAITESPVVIADVSDNPGGGAPGDSTFVLKRMLERGITNAAVGCIYDPISVKLAFEAGIGGTFELRVGGKMGRMSGDPLDLMVTVTGLKEQAAQHFGSEGAQVVMPMGDCAAVRASGIDIVLYSIRGQTFSPEVFSNVGIDPMQRHILIVKSTQHFYAAFSKIASKVLYIAAPGTTAPDFKSIPYEVASKNRFPMVDNPLGD
ncbi:MAG: M81 family metallopeptidase [Anaerolineae bacterium]